MAISGDYLDIDSTATYELLSPAKQILEDGAVLKSTKIFFCFRDENASVPLKSEYRFTNSYEPFLEMPESDLELFNLLKAKFSVSPEDEDEKNMTPEQLIKERDPEGIFQMSLESEKVQQLLAQTRGVYRKELELGAFGKIREAYQEALEDLREKHETRPLTQIKITVIYAKRSDLDSNLSLDLGTQKSKL